MWELCSKQTKRLKNGLLVHLSSGLIHKPTPLLVLRQGSSCLLREPSPRIVRAASCEVRKTHTAFEQGASQQSEDRGGFLDNCPLTPFPVYYRRRFTFEGAMERGRLVPLVARLMQLFQASCPEITLEEERRYIRWSLS